MKKVFHIIGKGFLKAGLSLMDKNGDGKLEVEELLVSALEIVKLTK